MNYSTSTSSHVPSNEEIEQFLENAKKLLEKRPEPKVILVNTKGLQELEDGTPPLKPKAGNIDMLFGTPVYFVENQKKNIKIVDRKDFMADIPKIMSVREVSADD